MTKEEIKKIWRNLLIPIGIGTIVFTGSFLYYTFGSKLARPQVFSMLGCILGLVFMILPGIKAFRFRAFLKQQQKNVDNK